MRKMEKILVLGSQGQIGQDLCKYLRQRGKQVDEIDIVFGEHHDLRIRENSLFIEKLREADFTVFLAFDVGGAKYLSKKQREKEFIYNNLKIMENVFHSLDSFGKPFFFASSQMALLMDSPYGNLKRIGEFLASAIGGKSLRFWNVFGIEPHNEKSHVITDFIHGARNFQTIDVMTNGQEERDFLHVYDASRAILTTMEHYDQIPDTLDIASFTWTPIAQVAQIVAELFDAKVTFAEDNNSAETQRIEPRRTVLQYWQPQVELRDGIEFIVKQSLS